MLSFRKIFRWHVLAWLAFITYSLLGEFILSSPAQRHGLNFEKGLWLNASFLTARVAEFYFCYLLVYPHLLRVGRLPQLLAGLGAAVLVFAGVRAGIEEVIYPALLGFHNYTPDTTVSHYLLDNVYYALPTLVLSAALWAGQAALRRERENRQLLEEKRAAEAAFLKTQINPHFLYNTLNMLYSMAYPVAKPVASAILKLSELMRYMLHESPDGQVDLEQEIEYLHNYLALYRLRFPGNLFVDFTVTGEPAGRRVAPLVLIPFVENAIKHGVLDNPDNPVRIRLNVEGEQLHFEVENHRSDDQKDAASGIGLPNIVRRLELLYPKRHTLRVGSAGEQFTASLRLVG